MRVLLLSCLAVFADRLVDRLADVSFWADPVLFGFVFCWVPTAFCCSISAFALGSGWSDVCISGSYFSVAAVGLFRFCLNVGQLWQPHGFQCASNVRIRIWIAFQTDLAAEVHVASMYCRFRYGLKPRNLLGGAAGLRVQPALWMIGEANRIVRCGIAVPCYRQRLETAKTCKGKGQFPREEAEQGSVKKPNQRRHY
jgi:hypothetical protein